MLRSLDSIVGYRLRATDDDIGHVKDFLFDDDAWVVRYLVADTGTWLPGRKVLISPQAMGRPDWEAKVLPVGLTTDQVAGAPGIEQDLPVSRQHEQELAAWYGWAPYWSGPVLAESSVPVPVEKAEGEAPAAGQGPAGGEAEADPHLRSVEEVRGYRVSATDERVGTVRDLIADTEGWIVRYLVVDTGNWLKRDEVLVSPTWADGVLWDESELRMDLTARQIEDSPRYDPGAPVNREYEQRLFDYYGRPKYWA
jgi:hypothetical protein